MPVLIFVVLLRLLYNGDLDHRQCAVVQRVIGFVILEFVFQDPRALEDVIVFVACQIFELQVMSNRFIGHETHMAAAEE